MVEIKQITEGLRRHLILWWRLSRLQLQLPQQLICAVFSFSNDMLSKLWPPVFLFYFFMDSLSMSWWWHQLVTWRNESKQITEQDRGNLLESDLVRTETAQQQPHPLRNSCCKNISVVFLEKQQKNIKWLFPQKMPLCYRKGVCEYVVSLGQQWMWDPLLVSIWVKNQFFHLYGSFHIISVFWLQLLPDSEKHFLFYCENSQSESQTQDHVCLPWLSFIISSFSEKYTTEYFVIIPNP